jgi:hypothetical protein
MPLLAAASLFGCGSSDGGKPVQDGSAVDAAGDTGGGAVGGTDAGPDSGGAMAGGADGSVASDGATDSGSEAGAPRPSAAFRTIYDTILMPKCGGSALGQGCHVGNVSPDQPALALPDALTAYANLVNQPTVCRSRPMMTDGRIRVVPFDPAKSAIMIVNADGLCGRRHNLYLQNGGFTEADLAAFEAWIRQGAP